MIQYKILEHQKSKESAATCLAFVKIPRPVIGCTMNASRHVRRPGPSGSLHLMSLGFRVQGLEGLGFRVQGLEGLEGLGLRV